MTDRKPKRLVTKHNVRPTLPTYNSLVQIDQSTGQLVAHEKTFSGAKPAEDSATRFLKIQNCFTDKQITIIRSNVFGEKTRKDTSWIEKRNNLNRASETSLR